MVLTPAWILAAQVLTSTVVALLEEMLQLDPEKRCSAARAIRARYMYPYLDLSDEPVVTDTFDMSFLEANLTADVWKTVMYACSLSCVPQRDNILI